MIMSDIYHNKDTDDKTSFDRNISIKIIIPISLVEYLSQDYMNKIGASKFSKTKAFYDLIDRYLVAKELDDEMAINYTELSKFWQWSRPSVITFIEKLQKLNIVSVEKVINSNRVTIKPHIFAKTDFESCADNSSA